MEERIYYQPATGQVITAIRGSLEYLDISAYEHLPFIEGWCYPDSGYVENGVFVQFPEKPADDYSFDYATKSWQPPSNEVVEKQIIKQRAQLLFASDWTQLPNNPLTPELQAQWATYRQELRDITQQIGYPFNVVWPTSPQG